MGAIPGDLDTTKQPPMTVPLRHFVVGLGFLLTGSLFGVGLVADSIPGPAGLAHVHLLLAGWICITIMGAMTQFVPVWSGTSLYSRRLANVQLGLVVVGLVGFAGAFTFSRPDWLVLFGSLTLTGFWTFVYNIARTLANITVLDVSERHFAVALVFFLALTVLGVTLAIDLARPVFSRVGVTHAGVLGAHVAVAVFGAVLTTMYGALYQLGTMFTQTELHGIDHWLRSVEELTHPLGVILLAGGRLTGTASITGIGGVLIAFAAIAFSTVLARKLSEMQVPRTPIHTRYAVATSSLWLWAILSLPAWIADPLAPAHRFGAAGTIHLLVLGAIGFVVLGTLYHVIPFIVWVHRYSDRLGLEAVPMVDDLYDDRVAAVDCTLLVGGTALLVGSDLVLLPRSLASVGGVLVTLGVVGFAANVLLVLHRHGSEPLDLILLGTLTPRRWVEGSEEPEATGRLP